MFLFIYLERIKSNILAGLLCSNDSLTVGANMVAVLTSYDKQKLLISISLKAILFILCLIFTIWTEWNQAAPQNTT